MGQFQMLFGGISLTPSGSTGMAELKYLNNLNNLNKIIDIKDKLIRSFSVLRKYDWLVDSYVLDFYVDDHWSKLPTSLREWLERLEPEDLCDLLFINNYKSQKNQMWPLSLLALRQLLADLCIDRNPKSNNVMDNPLLLDKKLKHVFMKCVKPKKRHEIARMAASCENLRVNNMDVDFILDFGAGQGHLARLLGYGYGIQVCCLEMQHTLNEQAIKIDKHLERIGSKHLPAKTIENFRRPTHITLKLVAETQPAQLLETIKTSLGLASNDFRFGIVGLHPCGDLVAILMRMLLNCPQAEFIMFVGCCYMKLTTISDSNTKTTKAGYPLSNFMRQQPKEMTQLSYEAREISCHAIEVYFDRLRKGDYEHLKVHSFRATAERIIVKKFPDLKHCGLRSVKHLPGLKFQDYFYKAVQGLPAAKISSSELETSATENDLSHWKRIVIFYTLRLMFAPLIESIILYDRVLYMLENDCDVSIDVVFDPRLSPRNHVTTAVKASHCRT